MSYWEAKVYLRIICFIFENTEARGVCENKNKIRKENDDRSKNCV